MKKVLCVFSILPIMSMMLLLWGCQNNHHAAQGEDTISDEDSVVCTKIYQEASPCIKLFVENSGSMFGYVTSSTEFKDIIREIIYDKVFDNIEMYFYFINGDGKSWSRCFNNDDEKFVASLSKKGMSIGNCGTSDLTGMLNTMMTNATGDTVTILVSDGIYDIGTDNQEKLKQEGKKTQKIVRMRLNDNTTTQTMVVKMKSKFTGDYCFATGKRIKEIRQDRPYYIWIFGKGELLNKYFPDDKVSSWLGYKNHARFQVTRNSGIPFRLLNIKKGTGKIRPKNNTLESCDTRHNEFSFSIIVDFSSLSFSDEYLMNNKNYSCGNNYFKVSQINRASEQDAIQAGVAGYKRPFVITIETDRTPIGTLNIELKNNKPAWIDATNADNEDDIDTEHTFGFSTLMEGIVGAYADISASCPANFTVIFKK